MNSLKNRASSYETSRSAFAVVSGAGGLRRIQNTFAAQANFLPRKLVNLPTEEELEEEDAMWEATTERNASGVNRLIAELREEINRGETFALEDVIEERIMIMEI